MDFPAFSSICSSNKAECGVNAGWMRCECQSIFYFSCRFARGILCRWEDEGSKRRRVKKTKRQRDKGSKSQRVKETKGQRVKETKRLRVKETKGLRDEESKRQRDEERKRRRDEKTKTASPPIHLLFTSYSCPLHRPIRSNLFNSCPKTFERFVFKTVLHQRTPLRESSVKVKVGGKLWEWEAQERRRQSESRWQRTRLRRKP